MTRLSGKRLARACGTHAGIWLLIAFNYWQAMVRREQLHPLSIVIIGHVILASFVSAWMHVMFTPILEAPKSWILMKADTSENAARKSSSAAIPPRAYDFHGKIILGFDHYCGWLGVPIGLHNRKFFVQLLLYASALCTLGGIVATMDYRLSVTIGSEADDTAKSLMIFFSPGMLACKILTGVGEVAPLSIHAYLAIVNSVVGAVLFLFGMYHVRLLLTNTTTIDPKTTRWDVGRLANWCQVFGEHPVYWVLPLQGKGPAVDGLHYPEKIKDE